MAESRPFPSYSFSTPGMRNPAEIEMKPSCAMGDGAGGSTAPATQPGFSESCKPL